MNLLKPMVTIGVCVRNCESTIEDAIKSIMAQDYPHKLIEVIFVDDGSTDRTLTIIKEYAAKMDMKVKIFHHRWRGLGYSRNVVVKNASGKYIIWVDGDMILTKNHVRTQVEFMEAHKEVGVGKGQYALYTTSSLVAYLENISAIMGLKNSEVEIAYNPLGTGGSIYRVRALKEVGSFDEAVKGVGEDMDAELRMLRGGWKLCVTSAAFYERRRESWRELWREYFWHGYGGSSIKTEIKQSRNILYKMFPLFAILASTSQAINAYKKIYEKKVFLLPFHWFFKRTAWLIGFLKGLINGRF